nr:MAG TPA_asm: hypothetical protein [Caudoviricetes sp.]
MPSACFKHTHIPNMRNQHAKGMSLRYDEVSFPEKS